MKNVRIWFKKDNECRYISHLDLNRVMLRALHKSGIPIWHTEGFNPHPFATFPLPLSLGFRGTNEIMDVKLTDDDYSFKEIIDRLNECLPGGLVVEKVTEPVMKAGKVAYAAFIIEIFCDTASPEVVGRELKTLLDSESITVEKKSKRGMKTIDIKPGIKTAEVTVSADKVVLETILAAGSSDNINPNLILKTLEERSGFDCYTVITRYELFDAELAPFR